MNVFTILLVGGWLQLQPAQASGWGRGAGRAKPAAGAQAVGKGPSLLVRMGRALKRGFTPSPDFWSDAPGGSATAGAAMLGVTPALGTNPGLAGGAMVLQSAAHHEAKPAPRPASHAPSK